MKLKASNVGVLTAKLRLDLSRLEQELFDEEFLSGDDLCSSKPFDKQRTVFFSRGKVKGGPCLTIGADNAKQRYRHLRFNPYRFSRYQEKKLKDYLGILGEYQPEFREIVWFVDYVGCDLSDLLFAVGGCVNKSEASGKIVVERYIDKGISFERRDDGFRVTCNWDGFCSGGREISLDAYDFGCVQDVDDTSSMYLESLRGVFNGGDEYSGCMVNLDLKRVRNRVCAAIGRVHNVVPSLSE